MKADQDRPINVAIGLVVNNPAQPPPGTTHGKRQDFPAINVASHSFLCSTSNVHNANSLLREAESSALYMKRAQIDHAACAETPGSDPSNNIGALSREPYSMMPSPAAQHMDIPQEQGKQRWGSSMRPINAERNVAPGLQEVKSPGGRRETINEHINELAKIVPGCEKNKGSILKLAVQFITQLKENERQNIEKRGLEKCLTNEVITKLTASCYKFQAESQRAWDECQIYKRACENNGILPDEIKDRQENGEGAGRPDAARASSTQQSGRPEDEMSHLKRKRQSRSDDQALDSIMMPVEFGIPRWDDELREQAKEAHGIEHHSVEPEDEGTHLEKRYKSVKPSGHTKGRLNPSMSTKAQDTLLRFIQQFVKMVGKSSGTQCAHDSTIMLRPSISDEDYLKDALQIHASRLLSISAAAVNTSTGVKRKEATLTLYGAVLIEHYSVLIAHYLIMSIFHNTSPKVSHKDYLLQSMAPPDFSPERLGLTESSLMAVEDGVQSYLPDVFLDYFKGNMTNAELDVIVRLLESDEEIQLLALCSRFGLRRDDSSAMQIVESMMSEKSLPHVESQGYKAVFELTSWSITDFMQDQFGEDIAQPGSVVTLTGTSTLHVQASTCADYIKMTWPHTGSFFLELLEAVHTTMMNTMKVVLPNPKPILLRSDQGLQVNVNCIGPWGIVPYFEGHATDKSLLVQLGQQLSWMGSAFTVSPFRNRMAHSSPTFLRTRQGEFQISFRYNEIDESEKACWLPLFDGACIVAGFPISARAEEIGLEISLDLLAGLSGARHVFEYEGGLVMKGFSHMFVPVRRQLDRVQWHAVSSLDRETPLSYNDGILRCASRAMLDEVSLQDLASLRAIVGWCSQATTCLGSSHADYGNIDYTKADEANSGPRCTGTSFGFQQFGMAALDVKFGLKDGKSHFQRTGPYRRIIALAEKSPIVLHDVEEKRSWLVPATNVMLHIVQHRHHLNPFQVNGNPIILDTDIVTGWLAGMVLLKNRTQVLYDDDNYTFMDDILNTWSILEFLLAQNLTRQREAPGVRIPSSLHESLYGFEFKAVVQQDAPYNLKKTTISRNHGGWLKLIEDIDALVLFANGFGDVILPVSASKEDLCRKWKSVPHGQDYLATTTHMLQTLFDRAGSRVDRKYLTTKSKLRWHQGSSALFNECQDVTTCDCTRLQQLIPESAIKSAQTPTSIADEGAVIFGHPEPRSAPVRSTVSKISSSLYSQPNVPILPRIVRRRSGTNDERKGKIRRLDIEAGELSCKHKHRPQAMS